MFEHRQLDNAVGARDSRCFNKIADRFRRISAPPQSRQSRHARIVPSPHRLLLDQLPQLALAHQRVGQAEAVKLNLLRRENSQLLDEPLVNRLVIGELERAHRVRHFFQRVRLAMRVVVHRINAPLISRAVMLGMQNAVHDRIAHINVWRRHIDFRPQHSRPIGKLSGLHALKQIQIFFDRTNAKRTVFPRFSQRAAMLADLFRRKIVDVRLAIFDQLDRPLIQLVEIIRRVKQPIPPETEPLHVLHDGVDVLGIFLFRIRVVEAQVGLAAKLVGKSEVEADRLGVSDVQISVGLRREASLHTPVVLIRLQVFEEAFANEIGRARLGRGMLARLGLGC